MTKPFYLALLVLILAAAIGLRVYPSSSFKGVGFDENLYRIYVEQLNGAGLLAYPDIVENYLRVQGGMESAILPPTRFLYIFLSSLWSRSFGVAPLSALHAVSCIFSILTVVLGAAFALRLGGRKASLGVAALLACAPVQIHMAQHALIDGFFAFWGLLALWALWECLQAPTQSWWSGIYAGALALMVLTKENAAFIYFALLGVLALCWKCRYGQVTPRLLLLTVAGPLLGTVLLLFLAGGVENLVGVYRLLVAKAYTLEYAIKTGDGPWHRYLVDLLLANPLILLLAIGAACRLRWREPADRPSLYLVAFIVCSYALMCNVKYGMNLRYATAWDFPLCFLAFTQLSHWTALWPWSRPRAKGWLLLAIVVVVGLCELRQYRVLFVEHPLYELVSEGLLRALRILK